MTDENEGAVKETKPHELNSEMRFYNLSEDKTYSVWCKGLRLAFNMSATATLGCHWPDGSRAFEERD